MRRMFFRSLFSILFVFTFLLQAKSQEEPATVFYNVIQDDSVVMFFNTRYWFTEAYCANYKRYTRIDKNGDFLKGFTDSTDQHTILGKGNYEAGVKNGYFEMYYPNGNIKCKGNFKNNIEDGLWYFYYENGKPERTLTCTETDIFLTSFTDKDGNVTVTDGNGYFNGRVAADVPEFTNITASGKVVNGSPDGKWQSKYGNMEYCNEIFKDGKFIEGGCPTSGRPDKKKYKNQSILNSFFLYNYFADLEAFRITHCPDTTKYAGKLSTSQNRLQSYSFDVEKFTSYTWDEIKNVMDFQARGHNTEEYVMGENTLSIAFSVNDKGIPEKFRRISSWGDQFVDPITRVITKYAKFPPSETMLYFHFKLTINEGNTLSYRIYFSRNQSAL